jgi:hypothetical protein
MQPLVLVLSEWVEDEKDRLFSRMPSGRILFAKLV